MVSLGHGGDLTSFLTELKQKPEYYNHTDVSDISLNNFIKNVHVN